MTNSRNALVNLGIFASRLFDRWSAKGVIPGRIGASTNAQLRWGFKAMSTDGPVEAVARDFGGMIGGLFLLAIGRRQRLAKGMRSFRVSVAYVYEKVEHGEIGPHTGFPMRPALGRIATTIIVNYPDEFLRALESPQGGSVIRAFFREPGRVILVFALYPVFTFLVLFSVAMFVMKAMFDIPDSQKYALCELAIMESGLSHAAKDAALDRLRQTAPRTIIEYQYYVPLLVPFDGVVQDKVSRRNAAGEVIDNHSIIASVFKPRAIQIAQSLVGEVIALRSFLWLYRDERVAREKNHRETTRKYGPVVAQRIMERPLYPLEPEELQELIGSGPRAASDVAAVLAGLLRERALDDVASRIESEHLQTT